MKAMLGGGIDDGTKRRLFKPLFTTKKRSRGTGLDLASAYGMVRNHGGAIELLRARGDTWSARLAHDLACQWVSMTTG